MLDLKGETAFGRMTIDRYDVPRDLVSAGRKHRNDSTNCLWSAAATAAGPVSIGRPPAEASAMVENSGSIGSLKNRRISLGGTDTVPPTGGIAWSRKACAAATAATRFATQIRPREEIDRRMARYLKRGRPIEFGKMSSR